MTTLKRPNLKRTKTTLEKGSKPLPNGILKMERGTSFHHMSTNLGQAGQNRTMYLHDQEAFTYVAAIEIGTCYSGYAYCSRREGKSVAQHIEMNPQWHNADKTVTGMRARTALLLNERQEFVAFGFEAERLYLDLVKEKHDGFIDAMNPQWHNADKTVTGMRAPTALLLNERKEFVAFGFEAERLYLDLVKENHTHKSYYFRKYKPKLYGVKDLRGNSLVTDENGRQCSALKVFSLTLRYLKSHILNEICLRGKDVEAEDIRWVITVPAIWSDLAKQFIRRAAENAGIPHDMLKLCLEPEAASIFCQTVVPSLQSDRLPIYKSGTKFAVADIGGGITDIVVHEKRKDGLREISRGMGAKLGGAAVDKIFIQFLKKLLGDDIVEGFFNRYKKDFITMMEEFEQEKRKVTADKTSSIELRIPACLQVLCAKAQYNDNVNNLVFRSVYQGRVKVANHKFRIDATVSNELFRATAIEIAKLISHSLASLETATDVSILVVTGGFAKVAAVQEVLHNNLIEQSQIKQIIVPQEADLAVLKGAVVFGHNPLSISCRVVRETIGLRIARLFNPEMHPPAKRTPLFGVDYVLDIFSPFLTIGTRVPVGFISHQALTTTEPYQKTIEIDIYHSSSLSHNFVTDEGCEKLGKLQYSIPMPSEEGRQVYVDFMLGDTELHMFVTDKKTTMKTRYMFPVLPSGK